MANNDEQPRFNPEAKYNDLQGIVASLAEQVTVLAAEVRAQRQSPVRAQASQQPLVQQACPTMPPQARSMAGAFYDHGEEEPIAISWMVSLEAKQDQLYDVVFGLTTQVKTLAAQVHNVAHAAPARENPAAKRRREYIQQFVPQRGMANREHIQRFVPRKAYPEESTYSVEVSSGSVNRPSYHPEQYEDEPAVATITPSKDQDSVKK